MPNTVNITTDILAQNALEGFLSVVKPLGIFSTNFSPDPASKGMTVSVPLYGTIANAGNFNGSYSSNSAQTVNEVTISLNQHFVQTIECSDTDAAKGVDVNRLAKQAGAAVARSVFTGVLGNLTLNNTPNGKPAFVCAAGSHQFNSSGLLALRTSAVAWPEKAVLMDASYYSSMLGNLPQGTLVQDQGASNGAIAKAYGLPLHETNVAPFLAQYPSGKAIVASPSAIAIASRYLAPNDGGKAYIEARAIVDPDTNITLGMRRYYDADAGKEFVAFEWLGGYSAGVSGAFTIVQGA